MSKLLCNPKIVKGVVDNINKDRLKRIKPSEKELYTIEKELTGISIKKQKVFEMFEDGLINKEEFLDRKEYLNALSEKHEKRKEDLQVILNEANGEKVPYEVVQQILNRFHEVLEKSEGNAEKKILLQLILDRVTIDKARNIDSIELHLNDNLVKYLKSDQGDVSKTDASLIFMEKIKGYREMEIKLCI